MTTLEKERLKFTYFFNSKNAKVGMISCSVADKIDWKNNPYIIKIHMN